jgi:1,4-alpha-glucan branching enzyme
VIAFLRRAKDPEDAIVVVCNFTPVVRENYRIGVPAGGYYREILNTDSEIYGGSNVGNQGGAWGAPEPHGGRPFHLSIRVPPLGVLFLKAPKVS